MKVSVLIPVYNERFFLRELVRRVYEQSALLHEVVLVDDGSTDGSRQRIEELEKRYGSHAVPLKVLYKAENEGKGAALRAGLSRLTGDVVVIQDADLEYNPKDYEALLAPIRGGRADVVFGSRFPGRETKVLLFWHMVANRILTMLCNFLSDLNLTDVWTGYKVFRTDILRGMPLRARGFGFEPEVTIKIAKLGCRIFEVPIHYDGRTYAEGKKIGARDAVTGILAMLRACFDDAGALSGGQETARLTAKSWRHSLFLAELIRPYLGASVIESASGGGTLSRMLLDRDRLVLADSDGGWVEQLKDNYGSWEHVCAVRLDLGDPRALEASALRGSFDTAVACRLLEKAADEDVVLRGLALLLKPGGRLVAVLPAGETSFGRLDERMGRLRRYEPAGLERRIRAAGFTIEEFRRVLPQGPVGLVCYLAIKRLCAGSGLLERGLMRLDLRCGPVLLAVARKDSA